MLVNKFVYTYTNEITRKTKELARKKVFLYVVYFLKYLSVFDGSENFSYVDFLKLGFL